MTNYDFDNETETLYLIRLNNKGKETSREVLSAHFYPKKVTHDVDSGEICMYLHAEYREKSVDKIITRDQLQSSKLAELSKYGFPFSDSYVRKMILDWILEVEEQLDLEEVTKELGWKEYEGKKYFQLSEAVSSKNAVKVSYTGNYNLAKKGAYSDYLNALKPFVIPSIPAQTIVAFSVSSALAVFLDPELTSIFHMGGDSTTGKTTMIKLAASVWGSPEINTGGIAQTWHTTTNALINNLCGVNGLTLCFDELGVSKNDSTDLIYLISNGNEKQRMGDTEEHAKFAVNILSSGEIPMRTIDGINGTNVRLFEFNCHWTDSSIHAENIKSAIAESYGHLGAEFVKALLSLSASDYAKEVDSIDAHHINKGAVPIC